MNKLKWWKQPVIYLLFLVLILMETAGTAIRAAGLTEPDLEQYQELLNDITLEGMDYKEYLSLVDTSKRPEAVCEIEAKDYIRAEGMKPREYKDFEGMAGTSVYTEENGFIEYEVPITKEGLYEVSFLYYPVEGKSSSIQRGIFVDGKLPYKQLNLVEFSRIWVNSEKVWRRDNRGNDIKPTQVEAPEWIQSYCYDSNGFVTDRLSIYLTPGIHTITLYSRREPMMLRKIILSNSKIVESYEQVMARENGKGAGDSSNQMIRIEAEAASRKSSQMLYPSQDKSTPSVYPYSAMVLKNNTIGSNGSFRITGQWLEWDFKVPQSGYYYITLHARQNFTRGITSSRKITIDGEIPFREIREYGFRYKSDWYLESLHDKEGNRYKFYLEKGSHTLRMEAVLGEFSDYISEVQKSVLQINAIYRKVIRITGVEPDKYRDYNIEKNIPELKEEVRKVRDSLSQVITGLAKLTGGSGNREAVLKTMRDQLDYLAGDVERFTKVMGSYKINMSALGTWISSAMEQPLALDTIYIHSPDKTVLKIHNSFSDKFLHSLKTLYYSFVIDYNSIGNTSDKEEETETITVWVGSGRDQANVIKNLIDETFTSQFGINVNVMLVDMGTLLQATLSGQGPDAALQVAGDLPMNYGLRHAVVDLSEFPDLDLVKALFRESAMVPFEFEGKTFALPETQTYPCMFYRKDVLKELGLSIPTTWEEMKTALSVLSKNQMDLGMLPNTEQIYAMLLYQKGGQYYKEDGKASDLDSDTAVSAFKDYCEFYTDYRLDKDTSVSQRFRTGEAPLVIADSTLYNELQVSAPDIKGLWGFTLVPGTVREDGRIDHTVTGTGTAAVMMSAAGNKKAAWEFMKWWTSEKTQTQYGRELEALMGAAARYPTANVKAFQNLPWPSGDFKALEEQAEWLKGIPQVPGGYYSWRNLNNAFYHVVSSADKKKMQPREALTDYVRYINDEITFKRKEFGLPTIEGEAR